MATVSKLVLDQGLIDPKGRGHVLPYCSVYLAKYTLFVTNLYNIIVATAVWTALVYYAY